MSANDAAATSAALASAALALAGLDPTESPTVLLGQLASEARSILNEGRRAVRDVKRARSLIRDLEERLAEPHVFRVFPQYTVAYGLLYAFRQKWVPGDFQVGNLIATIPLAPRESRKIQKRVVLRESRQSKELRRSVRNLLNESSSTSAVTSEIVKRAEASNTVSLTAEGSYGNDEIYEIKGTLTANRDTKKLSQETKKAIRERTLKAVQDLREERQVEVDTTSDQTTEETSSGDISNPNDEISVTYLYYELQRRFDVSEALHKITPVIFVANPFPKPNDIDRGWLVEHDWILRRVILDDSFVPTLDLLKRSGDGERLSLRALRAGMEAAMRAVADTRDYVATQERLRDAVSRRLDAAIEAVARVQAGEESEGVLESIHEFFHGSSSSESTEAAATRREAAESVLARLEEGIAGARTRLSQLESAAESATREYVEAVRSYTDAVQQITALRVHVKQNITYYMHAIWKHEHRDQRYFRLFDKGVPFIPINPAAVAVTPDGAGGVTIDLPAPGPTEQRRLDEIADVDDLLGFKGNYMIFALREPCHIPTSMMAGFLSAELDLVDPDASSTGISVAELAETMALLIQERDALALGDDTNRARYEEQIVRVATILEAVGRESGVVKEAEEVIVPTDMLYIEALPGANPVLENFKLMHRRLDAEEVRTKVKQGQINNLRMAALLRSGSFVDPEIDKQIFIKSEVPLAGHFDALDEAAASTSSGTGRAGGGG